METLNVITEESLYCFLQKHGDNRVKREILLFWSMHPNARFDRRAICYALDCRRLEVERALGTMVEAGLLDNNICNGQTLYSLTTNEDRRQPLLALAALGWDRWQLLVIDIEQTRKVVEYQDKAEEQLGDALKLISKY